MAKLRPPSFLTRVLSRARPPNHLLTHAGSPIPTPPWIRMHQTPLFTCSVCRLARPFRPALLLTSDPIHLMLLSPSHCGLSKQRDCRGHYVPIAAARLRRSRESLAHMHVRAGTANAALRSSGRRQTDACGPTAAACFMYVQRPISTAAHAGRAKRGVCKHQCACQTESCYTVVAHQGPSPGSSVAGGKGASHAPRPSRRAGECGSRTHESRTRPRLPPTGSTWTTNSPSMHCTPTAGQC